MTKSIQDCFAALVKYVTLHDTEDLIHSAFQSYFSRTNREIPSNLDDRTAFDQRLFQEFVADSTYFSASIEDIKENIEQYKWLFGILHSDDSRHRLVHILLAKLFIDPDHLKEAYTPYTSQYFLDEYFTFDRAEVLVDGGAYTGDTALEFINICSDFEKLYLFEPLPHAAREAKRAIGAICPEGTVEVFEKGLFNREAVLPFNCMEGEGDSRVDETGEEQIQCVRLDQTVGGPITFIKLDIEGMEGDAIEGAKNIIQRDNPQMAVCVYHKPGDFWQLPRLILHCCPDYTFELRQCMPHEFCDTILYCIPTGKGKRTRARRDKIDECRARRRMMMTPERTAFIDNLLSNKKDYLRICVDQNTALSAQNVQLARLSAQLQQNAKASEAQKQAYTGQIECLSKQLQQMEQLCQAQRREYEDHVQCTENEAKELRAQIASLHENVTDCENKLEAAYKLLRDTQERLRSADARNVELEHIINAIYASSNWRMTKPMRTMARVFHRAHGDTHCK